MREKAAHPTPASDAALIETIKQISEFMVYGDKHDDKFFECVVVTTRGNSRVYGTLLAVRRGALYRSYLTPVVGTSMTALHGPHAARMWFGSAIIVQFEACSGRAAGHASSHLPCEHSLGEREEPL
jgi:hypothetical protein